MYLQFKSLTFIKNFMMFYKIFNQFHIFYHYNNMFNMYYYYVEFFRDFNMINKCDKNIYSSILLL